MTKMRWTTMETRGKQFMRMMEELIKAETDPERKAGLEKSKEQIDIEKIEVIFSPVNIIVVEEDVSQSYYHPGSGIQHLLRIIFHSPEDKKPKQEPTCKIIEISLERNSLHYRKDGVSKYDWWSLVQLSRWNTIDYHDDAIVPSQRVSFAFTVEGEPHMLTIDKDGEYRLHSRACYYGGND